MWQRWTTTTATIAFVLGVAVATAQDSQRPQGKADTTNSGSRGPGRGRGLPTTIVLLGMPEVREELGINSEQRGLLEDIGADLQRMFREGGSTFEELRKGASSKSDLSAEERQKRRDELRKRGEEFGKKVQEAGKRAEETAKMILDDKQAARLEQLQLQFEGSAALLRADIADRLRLTEEQRQRLEEIREASRAEMEAAFKSGASKEERTKVFSKERREKVRSDLVGVLTPEQAAKWSELQGKKFTFPERPAPRNRPLGDRTKTPPEGTRKE